jgi:hypothetical protein
MVIRQVRAITLRWPVGVRMNNNPSVRQPVGVLENDIIEHDQRIKREEQARQLSSDRV